VSPATLRIGSEPGFSRGMRSSWSLPGLLLAAVGASGCGIVTSEFDGSVTLDSFMYSKPDERFFDGCVSFDPNEDEDFRENKDKLESGIIRRITIQVTEVYRSGGGPNSSTEHEADYGVGQIDVRRNPDPTNPNPTCDRLLEEQPFIEAAARWDPVPLERGANFDVEIDPSVMEEVHSLVFDQQAPLEVRFVGIADEQVNFDFQVRFELEFDVSLP